MNLLNSLNAEQKAVVEYGDHILVNACPGSGKTRTLVAKLIFEGSNLKKNEKVAAITYTNLAADEISQRLEASSVEDQSYWGGTIHGFCAHWIVRPFSHLIQELRYGYSFIDEEDTEEIVDNIKRTMGLANIDINTRRNANGEFVNLNEQNEMLLKEYDYKLKNERLVDFDLMLYYSYRVLRDNNSVAKNLSTIFKWVLIDEYQDTQELQYLIIGEIVKSSLNQTKLLIVGDPNQSIYQTLGGVAKTRQEIEEYIGGYHIQEKNLIGNYRSSQQIIDMYSNFQIYGEKIEAKGDNKDTVSLITYYNQISVDDLAQFIQETIVYLHNTKGVPYKEIAIIAPQWAPLINIARAIKLIAPDIPLDAVGLSPLCKDENNLFYYLSKLFLSSPAPDKVVQRLKWAKKILEVLDEKIPGVNALDIGSRRILKISNSFVSDSQIGIDYLKEAFSYFFDKLNLRIDSFQILVLELSEFERKCLNKERRIGLGNSISVYKNGLSKSGGVTFISSHKCKGLEYDTVISFCLLWGFLPHWGDIFSHDIDEYEISRKMLYVISSRARNNLILIAEKGRVTRNGIPYNANHHIAQVFRERS